MGSASRRIQFTEQPYIDDPRRRIERIKSIKFCMFSDADILKAAVVNVYREELYDRTMTPIEHGLFDARMGPLHKNGLCSTCNGNFTECPGHFGYVALSLPVYNVGYLSTVLDILRCICKNCSRLLLKDGERRKMLKKIRNLKIATAKDCIFKSVVNNCIRIVGRRGVHCARCGCINGMVKKTAPLVITHCQDGSPLDPKSVRFLFRNMLDEDCELLNLKERPEKLLLTIIPVPPPAIRPPVSPCVVDEWGNENSSREDGITCGLLSIVKANNSLGKALSTGHPSGVPVCHCWSGFRLVFAFLLFLTDQKHPAVALGSVLNAVLRDS